MLDPGYKTSNLHNGIELHFTEAQHELTEQTHSHGFLLLMRSETVNNYSFRKEKRELCTDINAKV